MNKTYWKCVVCAAVFEGTLPPEICPICKAGREAFIPYVPEETSFRKDTEERIAIIGSGAAATAAAESIRKRNSTAKIDIFTREGIIPYFRPILIRAMNEKIKDRQYFLHPAPFYANRNIGIHTGKNVESADVMERNLVFAGGERVPFDKLLVATGARNFIPQVPGAHLPGVLTLREAADFDRLRGMLRPESSIAIIGGGLLGLELAGILNDMKCRVSVVELRPAILPKQTDSESSAMLEKIILSSGVNLLKGVKVCEIAGKDRVEELRLSSGSALKCDLAIFSIGIESNLEIAKSAGIACGSGILVDSAMRTSHGAVFAAGDCAEFCGRTDGTWESAAGQGRIAGSNIAGDAAEHSQKAFGALLNAFGTKLFSAGDPGHSHPEGKYEVIARKDDAGMNYCALYFLGGKAVGGILLGDARYTCNIIAAIENGWDASAVEASGMKLG